MINREKLSLTTRVSANSLNKIVSRASKTRGFYTTDVNINHSHRPISCVRNKTLISDAPSLPPFALYL